MRKTSVRRRDAKVLRRMTAPPTWKGDGPAPADEARRDSGASARSRVERRTPIGHRARRETRFFVLARAFAASGADATLGRRAGPFAFRFSVSLAVVRARVLVAIFFALPFFAFDVVRADFVFAAADWSRLALRSASGSSSFSSSDHWQGNGTMSIVSDGCCRTHSSRRAVRSCSNAAD